MLSAGTDDLVVPSLSTFLCMLLGPGDLPPLRNLTIHKVVIIIHVQSVIIGVFRGIKIFIVILYKLVDLTEVL